MTQKPMVAIKEYCESFETETLNYRDSDSFRTGHWNCEKMLYLVLFKARFHLSYRVLCPKQYVSICPDYLRLQNDIQAESLRQEGGKGILSLLLCEQKYQIRNLKMCHLLIQSNTISPLQEQAQLTVKQKVRNLPTLVTSCKWKST